eukprot:Opistho-1_new@61208
MGPRRSTTSPSRSSTPRNRRTRQWLSSSGSTRRRVSAATLPSCITRRRAQCRSHITLRKVRRNRCRNTRHRVSSSSATPLRSSTSWWRLPNSRARHRGRRWSTPLHSSTSCSTRSPAATSLPSNQRSATLRSNETLPRFNSRSATPSHSSTCCNTHSPAATSLHSKSHRRRFTMLPSSRTRHRVNSRSPTPSPNSTCCNTRNPAATRRRRCSTCSSLRPSSSTRSSPTVALPCYNLRRNLLSCSSPAPSSNSTHRSRPLCLCSNSPAVLPSNSPRRSRLHSSQANQFRLRPRRTCKSSHFTCKLGGSASEQQYVPQSVRLVREPYGVVPPPQFALLALRQQSCRNRRRTLRSRRNCGGDNCDVPVPAHLFSDCCRKIAFAPARLRLVSLSHIITRR